MTEWADARARLKLRLRRLSLVSSVLALAGVGVHVPAAHAETRLTCGQTLTASVTLSADVGPCGGDGLILARSGITLNLNRHTIRGSGSLSADQVGIRAIGVSNVTITNGTVSGFNAGVTLEDTDSSTVSRLRAKDNRGTGETNHGDGILIDGSTNNQILNNEVSGNGPFAGVGLVDGADHNVVRQNNIHDNTLVRAAPEQVAPRQEDYGVRFDTGSSFNTIDRNTIARNGGHGVNAAGFEHTGNVVTNNLVWGNGQYGILQPGADFVISHNTVVHNGFDQFEVPGRPKGSFDGILVFGNLGGAPGVIEDNRIQGNAHDGFAMRTLGFTFFGTYHPPVVDEIRGNVSLFNGRNGIFIECEFVANLFPQHVCIENPPPHEGEHIVGNTARGNGGTNAGVSAWDLYDENPDCDSNQWIDNHGDTANPPCTLTASNGT